MSLRQFLVFAGVLLSLAAIAGCNRSPAANVAASVNNRPITYTEIEKAYQSQFSAGTDRSSEDQVLIQKLEILRGLIENEIMLQRAEKAGLMAVDADVEAKLTELKSPYTQEEFNKKLEAQKMTMEDLKAQLRKNLSIEKLLNKEITSHIVITDADVTSFYNANKAGFNLAEPRVHMAQIMVTPTPDPDVRNLRGDKAQNEEEARKKVQMIEARLRQGEDFGMIAQSFSEDPNSAPNGGDLGYIPESALEKANMELRKMVMSLSPGQLSPIIRTQEGFRILKMISKEPSGQRQITDPRVQQAIRETLLNRKDQLLKAAYYEVARNEAKVANYLARNITDKASKSGK